MTIKPHAFRNKLILNQWLISQFGIDPLAEHKLNGRVVRPFHVLADPIRDARMEGMTEQNLHRFFENLVRGSLFPMAHLSEGQLLSYEENIVRHTRAINEKRRRPIGWKYFQWLTLLFTEIYLDHYFRDRAGLMRSLNEYIERFNQHYTAYKPIGRYWPDDLNKLCYQNATGSGKTLLMHVNLLQYQHYATQANRQDELSRVILLTPNERLSDQHLTELEESNISASSLIESLNTLHQSAPSGLRRVDILEITKLADQEGPQQKETRSLGDSNLLLVDEGHRGMSGKEEGAWFRRRNMLCAKGFTFEYSATFEQAVAAAKSDAIEDGYAKCVIFDYSYRYFYEDGFGKDYHILNLPDSKADVEKMYLTACLLKFYQQLRIFEENRPWYEPFNLEKPLWVFVGSSVQKASGSNEEKEVASDVARVLQFVAGFLHDQSAAKQRIESILRGTGEETGLLDEDGNDIFRGAFLYLQKELRRQGSDAIYRDILDRLFNNPAGGTLLLDRIPGDSGEIALKCGTAEEPFGLINVGDAKGLCDHVEAVAASDGTTLRVEESAFTEAIFATVKDSSSPVNLLIGSKKFIEGWDCWRVSTMGLMHVGKSEGSQIIQLFGRGVRLKGWEWTLKRSGRTFAPRHPPYIAELETLNVFGIAADFMQRFRDFLREEGLPGNERVEVFTIPLNITYDIGKGLKVIRPKRKKNGKEYDFKRDGPIPRVGDIPEYLKQSRIESDWYSRIQVAQSRAGSDPGKKHEARFKAEHLALLDHDALYFEVEDYKRIQRTHNLNVSKQGILDVLKDESWYNLLIPEAQMLPTDFRNVLLWQQVATELLKRYCDRLHNYRKREFIEPRLELRDLTLSDENFPETDEYQLIVDASEAALINDIRQLQHELAERKSDLIKAGELAACRFSSHLYEPLLHARKGEKIAIAPRRPE